MRISGDLEHELGLYLYLYQKSLARARALELRENEEPGLGRHLPTCTHTCTGSADNSMGHVTLIWCKALGICRIYTKGSTSSGICGRVRIYTKSSTGRRVRSQTVTRTHLQFLPMTVSACTCSARL